jgi:hypothetical protein
MTDKEMRLAANGFEAWVKIDGEEIEHFHPETVDEPSGQTCWIASQLNKVCPSPQVA